MNVKVKGLILTLLIVGTFATILTITQATAYTNANGDITQEQLQNQDGARKCESVCQNSCECDCANTCRNGEENTFEYHHRTRTKHMNQECSSNQLKEMSQNREQYRCNVGKHNES